MNDYRMVVLMLWCANKIGLVKMTASELRLKNGVISYIADIKKCEGIRARF